MTETQFIPGDWIQFANLETQHFFERFGETLGEDSICKRARIDSGPSVNIWGIKQGKKMLCRVCQKQIAIRLRAKEQQKK